MRIQQFNNYQTDLLQVILWQYNEATNLLALLNDKQAWYNQYQSQFWVDWYNNVFNLSSPTLNEFGATVWSIILNVPLFIAFFPPENPADSIFGFNAYDPDFPDLLNSTNWNFFGETALSDIGANFYAIPDLSLSLQEQQFLLRLRYFQITNLGDIVDINAFLNYLCLDNLIGFTGQIYIIDNYGMSVTYNFTTDDFPEDLFEAITALDLWPRPAGVAITFTGL